MKVLFRKKNCDVKNVLIYAGTVRSGGSRSVLTQILFLLRDKYQVTIACSDLKTIDYLTQELGITDEEILPFLTGRPQYQVYLASKVYFLFSSYDAVVSLNQLIPMFGKRIIYFVNLFNFIRDPGASWLRNRMLLLDGYFALRFSDHCIFESNFLRNIASNVVEPKNRKFTVQYVGVAKDLIEENVEFRPRNLRKNQILVVSSPSAHKDIDKTIDIFEVLRRRKLVDELIIVGGQDKQSWDKYLSNRDPDIVKDIKVLGPVLPSIVKQLYSTSMYTLCTSKYESFYMVALESMINGCPVIIVDNPSSREAVGNEAMFIEDCVDGLTAMTDLEYQDLVSSGQAHAALFVENNYLNINSYL